MNDLNFSGLVLGFFMIIITYLGHIFIIKGGYYVGTKLWPLFLILGLLSIIGSLFVKNVILSGILGIIGLVFLWSIYEIFLQKERVRKGWFPKNPNRRI